MADTTKNFFQRLRDRGYEPLLHYASGTLKHGLAAPRSAAAMALTSLHDMPSKRVLSQCTNRVALRRSMDGRLGPR